MIEFTQKNIMHHDWLLVFSISINSAVSFSFKSFYLKTSITSRKLFCPSYYSQWAEVMNCFSIFRSLLLFVQFVFSKRKIPLCYEWVQYWIEVIEDGILLSISHSVYMLLSLVVLYFTALWTYILSSSWNLNTFVVPLI